ncbi:2Fe-2S iron-sulfur cluster-binding protein [Notoacmeibacter sp. MSK16QG-6]|uniref:2Fe-2S iron-sulfur cluster-binding protein n=1 Tax=Notoacmeibacter sp. MSK16QG-6 TaxID=2957982 RepID=UPI0020A1B503|nr:2Fe-2S iron-sulfur cluster-binding protein [Notoacmeibacter sp. MSK16QG-6]MCP1200878.1 2Fe-2S iron-sulfur cluster-binding protein [Notoacmeibacter sp. MSK16QG-6]
MSRFMPLMVTGVERDTRDSVIVSLQPRDEDRGHFCFTQGQYLTFRRMFGEDELRRSYSICAGCDDPVLRVGIKRVDGGAFSTFANEELKVGDTLDAMPPQGRFNAPIDADNTRHYVGFAAGSGITPVLSIIRTILKREPQSRFTLVYANRQVNSIMFREELEDLKNLHLGRLSILHILKSEAEDSEVFGGRIDREKLDKLFELWIDPGAIDTAFICGPEALMLTIAGALRDHGLDDSQIKFELFASSQPGRAAKRAVSSQQAQSEGDTEATITLDGTTRSFAMRRDVSLLDAALQHDIDAPYSCKAGVCSTCRAKVLEGDVDMETNHALEDYEVRAGYVLSCQCYPMSDKVVLSYDE